MLQINGHTLCQCSLLQPACTPARSCQPSLACPCEHVLFHGIILCSLEASSSACQPTIIIAYEYSSDPFMQILIPINNLRNMALLAARTPLVAMVDVDLMVSRSLSVHATNKAL